MSWVRRQAVMVACRLLDWADKGRYKGRLWVDHVDPLDVWFEWRFLFHYRIEPKPLDWDRLWAVWKRPK